LKLSNAASRYDPGLVRDIADLSQPAAVDVDVSAELDRHEGAPVTAAAIDEERGLTVNDRCHIVSVSPATKPSRFLSDYNCVPGSLPASATIRRRKRLGEARRLVY